MPSPGMTPLVPQHAPHPGIVSNGAGAQEASRCVPSAIRCVVHFARGRREHELHTRREPAARACECLERVMEIDDAAARTRADEDHLHRACRPPVRAARQLSGLCGRAIRGEIRQVARQVARVCGAGICRHRHPGIAAPVPAVRIRLGIVRKDRGFGAALDHQIAQHQAIVERQRGQRIAGELDRLIIGARRHPSRATSASADVFRGQSRGPPAREDDANRLAAPAARFCP